MVVDDGAHCRGRPFALLEQHEFVERVVPLHKEDSGWRTSTQILVAVVRVPYDAALGTLLRVGHLGGERKLSWDELLRYSLHVHVECEPTRRLLGMERHQVVTI